MTGAGWEPENNDITGGGQAWLDILVNSFLNGPNPNNRFGGSGAGIPGGGPEANPMQGGAVPGVPGTPIPGAPGAAGAAGATGGGLAGLLSTLQRYGPLAALGGRALFGGGPGGGSGDVPTELQAMLAEAMRRMQAQGPLFDSLNAQAMGSLPRMK